MEIIRINDAKLKITLDDGDMERYALSPDTMDYDNTETRRVLWQILDEAKRRTGFDAARDRALIQAYPGRRGGCEIYVTLHPTLTVGGGRVGIYAFTEAAALFSACRHLSSHADTESALYYEAETDTYYLLIRENGPHAPTSPLRVLEEYTVRRTGHVRLAYIKEHAQCLLSEGALGCLAALSPEGEPQKSAQKV